MRKKGRACAVTVTYAPEPHLQPKGISAITTSTLDATKTWIIGDKMVFSC